MVLIAFCPTSRSFVFLLEWNCFCLALHQHCITFFSILFFSFLRSSSTETIIICLHHTCVHRSTPSPEHIALLLHLNTSIHSFTWTHVSSTAQHQHCQLLDTFVNFPLPHEFSAVPDYHSMVRLWRHESYSRLRYSTKKQQL